MAQKPQHLEMTFNSSSTTWTVQPAAESRLHKIDYPSDAGILRLAKKHAIYANFFVSPHRPGDGRFLLYVKAGTTKKARDAFLHDLEAASQIKTRTFSKVDLENVMKQLAEGPLYELVVAGERHFGSLWKAAGLLNHSFVSGQPVGDLVLEIVGQKLTLRLITDEEKTQINNLADEISDSKPQGGFRF